MLRRERCPTLAFPADRGADFRGTFPDTPIFSMIHLHSTIVPRVLMVIFQRFPEQPIPMIRKFPTRREGPCVAAMVLVLGLLKRAPAGR
jgi:hypothetical protein